MSEPRIIHDSIKSAQVGDGVAWNLLYNQYYPGLYSVALRICNNIPMAQDAVQDSFMTAYLKLSQLKDTAAFGGWIKRILINACYKLLHKNSANTPIEDLPLKTDTLWEDEINKKLDKLSTQDRLYASLANLPEVLRSTMLLRYFSKFSTYEDIAAILSVPIGTVRSRLNQAKLKLTEQWQQHNETGIHTFEQCEEWNNFYHSAFLGMHHHNDCKNKFINHLQKNVQIISANGKPNTGSKTFEKMIVDDQEFGSWLEPDNVVSCGNISVIEARHFNSSEHPHHCPPRSVIVLYRHKKEVNKLRLHI